MVGVPVDDELIDAWRARVLHAGEHLGWTNRAAVARRHAAGVSLAITAPLDQLFLATEVNEWALCATLIERDFKRWSQLEEALLAAALDAAADSAAPSVGIPPVTRGVRRVRTLRTPRGAGEESQAAGIA